MIIINNGSINSASPQLSLKCRAPEVSQYIYQMYDSVLKNWTCFDTEHLCFNLTTDSSVLSSTTCHQLLKPENPNRNEIFDNTGPVSISLCFHMCRGVWFFSILADKGIFLFFYWPSCQGFCLYFAPCICTSPSWCLDIINLCLILPWL